jgi:hypothetical protein
VNEASAHHAPRADRGGYAGKEEIIQPLLVFDMASADPIAATMNKP